jgi:hypothetical protein
MIKGEYSDHIKCYTTFEKSYIIHTFGLVIAIFNH